MRAFAFLVDIAKVVFNDKAAPYQRLFVLSLFVVLLRACFLLRSGVPLKALVVCVCGRRRRRRAHSGLLETARLLLRTRVVLSLRTIIIVETCALRTILSLRTVLTRFSVVLCENACLYDGLLFGLCRFGFLCGCLRRCGSRNLFFDFDGFFGHDLGFFFFLCLCRGFFFRLFLFGFFLLDSQKFFRLFSSFFFGASFLFLTRFFRLDFKDIIGERAKFYGKFRQFLKRGRYDVGFYRAESFRTAFIIFRIIFCH